MKKTASLGALLLALALPLAAQAETVFAGEVTAETVQVIAAPYGGLVEDVRVRVGDSVKIGDPIATVETAKTYASTDGTVSGVFAHEGDSADGVKTQYGALVYIEPINRFTLACSTEKGYNSSENRYIHIGETVFLKCTKDGSHQGRGVVTGLDEKDDGKFTVEVTGGEFYMGETVDLPQRRLRERQPHWPRHGRPNADRRRQRGGQRAQDAREGGRHGGARRAAV